MIKYLRKVLGNPLVVAYAALLVALTGGTAAYAAATIGSADIINGSILSKDIKNGDVKGIDVGNDSLTGRDIDEATLAYTSRSIFVDVPIPAQPDTTEHPIATVNGMSVTYRCYNNGSKDLMSLGIQSDVQANVSAAWVDDQNLSSVDYGNSNQMSFVVGPGSTGPVLIDRLTAANTHLLQGELLYQTDTEVIHVSFHLNVNSHQCHAVGIITPTSR